MAPLAEVGGFLGGLEGLGQQVGSHFLLPPAGERPPLLGERRGAAERGARGGPGAAELAALLPQGVRCYLDALTELGPVSGLTLPPAGGAALILWFAGMLFVSEYFLPNRDKPAWLGWGLMGAGALVWFLV